MPDIKIKRYADKENLKKLMKYSKDTFANKSEVNSALDAKVDVSALDSYATKDDLSALASKANEIDTKLTSKANTSDLSNYYTKSEVNNLLSNISVDSILNEEIKRICVL